MNLDGLRAWREARLCVRPLGVILATACVLSGVGDAMPARADEAARSAGEPLRLLVPAGLSSKDDASLIELQDRLQKQLRAQGLPVTGGEAARRAIGRRGSKDPAPWRDAEAERMKKCSQDVLYHVAFGRKEEAHQSADQCLGAAWNSIETLHRSNLVAAKTMNVCLYQVRELQHAKQSDAAWTKAVECLRLVPDGIYDATVHPPWTRELFAKVQKHYQKKKDVSLRVHSETPGCHVFLNGRRVGTTPFELRERPYGAYKVHLHCPESGHRSRVYTVEATPDVGSTLHVDTRFDGALQTRRQLLLRYKEDEELGRFVQSDARRVGYLAGVEQVWSVVSTAQGVRIDSIDLDEGQVLASAYLHAPAQVDSEDLDLTVRALSSDRSIDLRGEAPRAAEAHRSEASLASRSSLLPKQPSGADAHLAPWWVVGLGGAAIAGGFVLSQVWRDEDGDVEAPWLGLGLSSVGSLAAIGGLSYALPERDGVPWWGWLAAGGGAALVAQGVVSMAGDGGCASDLRDARGVCAEVHRNGVLNGSFAFLAAAPLLSVPVIYLLRGKPDLEEPRAVSELRVVPVSGGFGLSGRF